MRCPKCKSRMFPTEKEYYCLCGYRRQRFIVPVNSHPLFLSAEVKNEETKKFLEDIMSKPEKPKRTWYFSQDSNLVFVRVEGQKHLEAYTVKEWAEKLIKEMREKE